MAAWGVGVATAAAAAAAPHAVFGAGTAAAGGAVVAWGVGVATAAARVAVFGAGTAAAGVAVVAWGVGGAVAVAAVGDDARAGLVGVTGQQKRAASLLAQSFGWREILTA